MIGRKGTRKLQLYGFIIVLVLHLLYAQLFLDIDITKKMFLYALGLSVVAAVSLYGIKLPIGSDIGYVCCIMFAVHFLGIEMQILSYSVVIYMLMGAVISISSNLRLSRVYAIAVNLSIIHHFIFDYEHIANSMRMEYYMMLVLFCDVFLVTQIYMVKIYCQKVAEMESKNALLNEAQKSKDEFLANMSHEIRTPMNAIVGMTDLIMREEEVPEKVKEYCYNIQASGENLLAIINDILDFSKIESGKLNIIYEPYSIVSVVQDVANTAMFRRGYKDVEIIIDCNPAMPKELIGDVVRNRQILMNIVINAVKYTEKGCIFISLSCREKDGIHMLHMEVQDTGIGIRQEDQKHLFDSFSRMDTTKNRSVEGTGLGLALCKRLTQAMNGTIQIESEYGVGTKVFVDIPQEIKDPAPFLVVENAQEMKVVMYGDREDYAHKEHDFYHLSNNNTWKGLNVQYRVIMSFTKLMEAVENNEVTHIYTGVPEYTDQRNYFNHIAKKIRVFVMYDPQYPAKFDANIHGVQIPFYSINLASSLNGESIYNQYIGKNQVAISFRAPYARVLLVDDNEVNLRVAEGVLKLYGVTCVLARSGKEAIELLKDQDMDMVFMDHMMPEMDGIEATKIIRRVGGEYGRNLPIIALTANAVNDAKQLFLENGFQDFIAKPISIKRVDAVMRRWLPGAKIEWINEEDKKEIPDFDEEEKKSQENPSMEETEQGFMVIDETTALENMGGQRDLFKELLEYCLELEEQRKQEINESFEMQDWEEYAIRVHALKGGMRSLGVEELALVAQEQEHAAKENRISDVIEGHNLLLEVYDFGHRSIEHYLKHFTVEV